MVAEVSPTLGLHAFKHGSFLLDQKSKNRSLEAVLGPKGRTARSAAMALSFTKTSDTLLFIVHQMTAGPARDLFPWFNEEQKGSIYQRLIKAFDEAVPDQTDVLLGPHAVEPLLKQVPPEHLLQSIPDMEAAWNEWIEVRDNEEYEGMIPPTAGWPVNPQQVVKLYLRRQPELAKGDFFSASLPKACFGFQ